MMQVSIVIKDFGYRTLIQVINASPIKSFKRHCLDVMSYFAGNTSGTTLTSIRLKTFWYRAHGKPTLNCR